VGDRANRYRVGKRTGCRPNGCSLDQCRREFEKYRHWDRKHDHHNIQLTKQFPQYISVTEQFNPSSSAIYDALQASFRQSNWHHLDIQAAYTWSKNLTDVSNLTTGGLGEGTPGYQNSHFLNLERSYAPGDVPQRFTAAVIYELPVGRGKKFLSTANPWIDEAIGGYRVSAIVTMANSLPIAVTDSGCPSYAGTRPLAVQGVSRMTSGSRFNRLGAWLNSAAFTCPSSLQLGNVARIAGDMRGDGIDNTDYSASKSFRVRDLVKLELRAEAKNGFNHARFGNPNATSNTSNFGQITSQQNNPRIVQVALRATW
jgi:hypothetical protein